MLIRFSAIGMESVLANPIDLLCNSVNPRDHGGGIHLHSQILARIPRLEEAISEKELSESV